MVPPAPLSNAKIVYLGGIVAGITVTAMYALTLLIGYPLPFGIVTVSPVWVHLLLAPLLSWMKKARADPAVWSMCINLVKIMVCQESLIFIYPTYFHLFTTISNSDKAAFSLLLPVMKIILRGVMARTVVHLKDEIPQIVVINVDLFSALFSTYCMQNAPSLKTTGVLMTAKAIQTCVSLYDIEIVVQRMKALKKQRGVVKNVTVHSKHRNSNVDASAGTRRSSGEGRVLSSNLFALVQSSTRKLSQTIQPFKQIATSPQKTHGLLASIAPLLSEFVDNDRRGPTKETVVDATISKSVSYVEVVIPLIFSAYLFGMYHLPNRAYYGQMVGMDDIRLRDALANVLLYAALQFASMVVLNVVLWQRLQISAFHQLSFVLEKQWNQVQNRMILWVFYNVQASLQHFGSDYTFKFLWLRAASD
ncbi:ABCG transporter ABC Superfamily [Phytophthora cinnamomi]|uniref:ABCG transporter ABC Superfamily n=1 Tax=Phytophthora cinnamomi TaxID=4785 RepID=UPI00355AAEA4|nr:ABCG transporter ABC Superfamily [Phytophthora cinnamomi]